MRLPSVVLAAIAALLLTPVGAAWADDTLPTDTATTDPTTVVTTDPTSTSAPTSAPTTDPAATTDPATTDPATTLPDTTDPVTPTTDPVTTAPTSTTDTTAPTTIPATTTATTTVPAPVHYDNCDAVHAAGHTLLWWWEPGYRDGLDRDDDGMACEFGDRPGRSHHWREHHHHDGSDSSHKSSNDSDSSDASDNDGRTIVEHTRYVTSIVDAPLATHTQWPTLPVGSIDTGDGTA